MRLSLVLLTILLNGCATLPPFPEVWQCGYTYKFKKFRCVNTESKVQFDVKYDRPEMEGAQCLPPDHYKSVAQWVAAVKEIAETKCH